MNQERKATIQAELKQVIPSTWKWSLAVQHHSTIVLNIHSAPVDLAGIVNRNRQTEYEKRFRDPYKPEDAIQLNQYHLDGEFGHDTEMLALFERIKAALNNGNFDHSDIQTDYFCVGWHVTINLGKWNKPFVVSGKVSPQPGSAAYEALKAQVAALQAQAHD